MVDVVERVAAKLAIPFTVGGGINRLDDMKTILRAGADKVSVNTAAVLRPELITEGADFSALNALSSRLMQNTIQKLICTMFIHTAVGKTNLEAVSWAKEAVRRGAGEILLTSMDSDGEKNGFDCRLTKLVSEAVSVPVIASGGAGRADHMYDAFAEGRADAALAASIFHYKETSVKEVKAYLKERGVNVR